MNTPFTNARVVCYDADPSAYCTEPEERGNPKFTMRSGVLSELLRNARRWVDGYESPESKAREYGDLLDCLALTPHKWAKRFVVKPQEAPKRPSDRQRNAKKPSPETLAAIKFWDEFNAENEGKTIVDPDDLGAVQAAIKALKAHEQIAELVECSAKQVWVAADYVDKATGLTVPVKCLIDLLPGKGHPLYGDALADLKTARNVSPRQFARACYDYGYDLQAALELDLYAAAKPDDARVLFWHISQENYHPYHCRLPQLGEEFVARGRFRYQFALAKYCRCLASKHWPGYDDEEIPVTKPEPWMNDNINLFDDLQEPEAEETGEFVENVP